MVRCSITDIRKCNRIKEAVTSDVGRIGESNCKRGVNGGPASRSELLELYSESDTEFCFTSV